MPDAQQAASSRPAQDASSMARNLTDVLDMLTHQAHSELGTIGQGAFFVGDGLQRAVTDGIFSLFNPATWMPTNLWRLGSDVVKQSIRISKLANPPNLNLAWEELKNKLEVFILVMNLPKILKLPPADTGPFIPIAELVPRAYSLSPFQALWAVEGLGHYYTDSYHAHFGNPQGLFSEAKAQVPDKSLTMLHAGMGLSFADRLIGNLNLDDPSPAAIHAAVEEFVTLCRNNAREGYLGCAIESLGLVTRDFYPELLNLVHQQLQQVAPDLVGYFWHGAGRALYFSREYFLPVLTTAWSGIEEETLNCPDQLSAMAGLSWALTVVNMRQPAIMLHALSSYTGNAKLARGFANGVSSTIIMRQDTTPDEPFISAFYQYRPDTSDQQSVEMWSRFVALPAQLALEKYYPVLKQHHALEQVFRYQDLAALVSRLQNRGPSQDSQQVAYQN
ncbi:MAG TPA: hypothetical protein VI685_26805 [Candidatus Angelobacter sp.]